MLERNFVLNSCGIENTTPSPSVPFGSLSRAKQMDPKEWGGGFHPQISNCVSPKMWLIRKVFLPLYTIG